MSHVQIRILPDGATSVVVDGMEMALKVAAGSLTVVFPENMAEEPVRVGMTVLADTVNLDLADAEVDRA